uniref:Uncharacterized protein n=1 Tax=Sciurus vulgaris TaxID=55149 RepID=A0A8D2CK45_SCIVU
MHQFTFPPAECKSSCFSTSKCLELHDFRTPSYPKLLTVLLFVVFLGARLGVSSCLGKYQKNSRGARKQPFTGKSFYLDLPAGKNLQFLTGAIQQLGGVIEGFLSKEVSYIVSSRREAKAESGGTGHRSCPSSSEVKLETFSVANPKGSHTRPSQKRAYSVPMSRGKELLQKAIRKQVSWTGHGGHAFNPSSLGV